MSAVSKLRPNSIIGNSNFQMQFKNTSTNPIVIKFTSTEPQKPNL